MSSPGVLDVVLPLALTEPGLPAWRAHPHQGAQLRIRLLLESFLANFSQDDLGCFWLVCPPHELEAVMALLRALTPDPRYRVISERELCPEAFAPPAPGSAPLSGWYIQQLLKLAIADRLQSPWYLTLDSDIVVLHPCDRHLLFSRGRALLNIETREDYRHLYIPAFAEHEIARKAGRYTQSRALLGGDRPPAYQGRWYGETPVLMHGDSVMALRARLEARFDMPWDRALARNLPWTEYGLYFQFLEQQGRLEALYTTAGSSALLDLPRSVWQITRHYRHPRPYHEAHFFGPLPDSLQRGADERGSFVAVQSWLDARDWLPPGCPDLETFYRCLGHWLRQRYPRRFAALPQGPLLQA